MLKNFKINLNIKISRNLLVCLLAIFLTSSCNALKPRKAEPLQGPDLARKNIKEGRGASIGAVRDALKRGTGTTYEFSTSNPIWRASLETLDFLPLTTVDYSGGMIITDWYYDDSSNNQDAIKISIRFLSNDIRSESLKIIVHKRSCKSNNNCKISILNQTNIKNELHSTILKKAALLERQAKEKKK